MAPGYELQKQYFLGVVGYVSGQWGREQNRRHMPRVGWWAGGNGGVKVLHWGAVGGAVSMLERKAEGREVKVEEGVVYHDEGLPGRLDERRRP